MLFRSMARRCPRTIGGLAVHPDESDHGRWIATNTSERPLYVQQPSFSTTNVLELRPGLSCALVEGSRIASSQHSGWLFIHEGDDARQPKNVATEIVPLSTIVASTPVVMSVLGMPSGTDVRIVKGSVGTTIVETTTDRLVPGTWPFDYETSEGASS